MKVFLLGNGFDLHHLLPTKYENFLHTIDFLSKNYNDSMKTVGDVFGNSKLQKEDKFIADSFNQYYDGYNKTSLENEKIALLVSKSKTNYWFRYLIKAFNKDAGWIDFEKEIAIVIEKFDGFLQRTDVYFRLYDRKNRDDLTYNSVLQHFNFFYDYEVNSSSEGIAKKEYKIEEPIGSNHYILNKPKLIKDLYKSLIELAEMLKLYLECFVEKPLDGLIMTQKIKNTQMFFQEAHVVTLNYTNSAEKIYSKFDRVDHIHGNIKNRIILGVNSDSHDELEEMDTSFICFKKYYQRVVYKTDESYLVNLQKMKNNTPLHIEKELSVVGHSLDKTDKDIIKDLFDFASKITIYYHDESAIGSYVSNLVTIYGKERFDELRVKKKLNFIPLE